MAAIKLHGNSFIEDYKKQNVWRYPSGGPGINSQTLTLVTVTRLKAVIPIEFATFLQNTLFPLLKTITSIAATTCLQDNSSTLFPRCSTGPVLRLGCLIHSPRRCSFLPRMNILPGGYELPYGSRCTLRLFMTSAPTSSPSPVADPPVPAPPALQKCLWPEDVPGCTHDALWVEVRCLNRHLRCRGCPSPQRPQMCRCSRYSAVLGAQQHDRG